MISIRHLILGTDDADFSRMIAHDKNSSKVAFKYITLIPSRSNQSRTSVLYCPIDAARSGRWRCVEIDHRIISYHHLSWSVWFTKGLANLNHSFSELNRSNRRHAWLLFLQIKMNSWIMDFVGFHWIDITVCSSFGHRKKVGFMSWSNFHWCWQFVGTGANQRALLLRRHLLYSWYFAGFLYCIATRSPTQ